MVKKYEDPLIDLVEKGPQISQWIRSKGCLEIDVLWGKDKRCCLANGHILQVLFDSCKTWGITWESNFKGESERWPNL